MDNKTKKIVAVTGGRGLVGRHIVIQLVQAGYKVKLLSRQDIEKIDDNVTYIKGDITDVNSIGRLLQGCTLLIHSAAELEDETKMRKVNVVGTQNILEALNNSTDIKLFFHISSAGVCGASDQLIVDETTEGKPQNLYEQTKKDSELLVLRNETNKPTIILRPVNVMDFDNLDVFYLPLLGSFKSKIEIFLKGRQLAHQVHAEDVARATIHLVETSRKNGKEIFIVGNDEDSFNTYSKIWETVRVALGKSLFPIRIYAPTKFTNVVRGVLFMGNTYRKNIYSSKKLLDTGFEIKWTIEKIGSHLGKKTKGKKQLSI